jgi:OmcA/MtrC family decaheme c-type cytochrome
MGKLLFRNLSYFFLVLMLVASVSVLTGCSGDDGAPGDATAANAAAAAAQAAADAAAADAAAAAAAVTHTEESCNVCHGVDAFADIAVAHPEVPPKAVVSNIVVTSGAGATDTVTFSVFEDDGTTGIAGLTLDDFRFYMADIVPAGDVTTTAYTLTTTPVTSFDTPYLERWMYERTGTSRSGDAYRNSGLFTDNGAGSYTYTFGVDLGTGAVWPVTAGFSADVAAPDFDATDLQRLMITADTGDMGFSRTVGMVDFVIPADGFSSTEVGVTREIVSMNACTQCHGDPLERAAHGGSYQSPQGCNVCHSPIGDQYGDEMQADGAWLAALIHGIHQSTAATTAWDWSEVTYPRHPSDCGVCHFNDGQAMWDEWMVAKAETCSTCHDVTFGANATHTGGTQVNADCAVCHPGSGNGFGQSVAGAHAVDTLKNDPAHAGIPNTNVHNYTATLTITPPANGTHYVAGEAPMVTVTTDGVNAGEYNNPAGPFTAANLYVYGPRSKAVPILTPGSTTDPAFDPETMTADQGRSMLIGAAAGDAQVLTDANGFKYQLQAIPADLAPGTYMVMAYATDLTDCSGVYRGSVCIDGWVNATIQIGNATVEPRVAGDCSGCHDPADWSTFYHRSYFGTDGCLACHDQSGNHADPIANRVHAVHAASGTGDLLGAAWDGSDPEIERIEFPRNIGSCEACHTSGNDSYITLPSAWGVPCIGCHGDTSGARDHMIQNGAPFTAH